MRFEGDYLIFSQVIVLDNENIGILFLRADYRRELNKLLQLDGGILAIVVTLSILLTALLTGRLQRVISEPNHPSLLAATAARDAAQAEIDDLDRRIAAARLLRQFHLPLTLAVADVPLQDLAARSPENVEQLYDILVARDLLHGRQELLRSLERQGIMVLDTVPERLTIDAVNRYLALKTGLRI